MKGKIVLCENGDKEYPVKEKFNSIEIGGAVGMIMSDNDLRQVASKYGLSPISAVTKGDGAQILSYINSARYSLFPSLPL